MLFNNFKKYNLDKMYYFSDYVVCNDLILLNGGKVRGKLVYLQVQYTCSHVFTSIRGKMTRAMDR